MSVHSVQCASRWDVDSNTVIGGGPMIVVDDEKPHMINHDGHILRVLDWTYIPERDFDFESKTYHLSAFIEAHMPMENGALLYLNFSDGETIGVSLGRRVDSRWQALAEMDDRLALAHTGCIGADCNDVLCLDHLLEDGTDDAAGLASWSGEHIERVWRRVGQKPIIERPARFERPSRSSVSAQPRPLDAVEQAIRHGRTVTIDEYRAARS